ncbi:MAG: exosortase/archaeosortase family protein [Singulisphaera sp.]
MLAGDPDRVGRPAGRGDPLVVCPILIYPRPDLGRLELLARLADRPIALAILWQRRGRSPRSSPGPAGGASSPGGDPGLSVLALRAERSVARGVHAAPGPGASVLAVGGWGPLRWALPGLVYLFLMLPLPPSIDGKLAGPLQTLATIGSVSVLQGVGVPVLTEGNVILIGSQRLEVAEDRRGLSMLLSFVALISAMVILVRRPLWERVLRS